MKSTNGGESNKNWYRIATWLSQGGNVLSDGNPDVSISAKLGWLTKQYPNDPLYRKLAKKVDRAFEPLDGPGHSRTAHAADQYEQYRKPTPKTRRRISFFVNTFVPIIKFAIKLGVR